ncbi:MAG: DUF1559 domain-containing protein [Gemmataceae bacterium]|nr:DUF1559 domain-containing protein [Gemmataceae bacterium]
MHRRYGFSLPETIIVIAVLFLLVGLLVAAVQQVREAAARISSENNLKQFTLAVATYTDGRGGVLPSADGKPRRHAPRSSIWYYDYTPHQAAAVTTTGLFQDGAWRTLKMFLGPADPTVPPPAPPADEEDDPQRCATGHTSNAQVFSGTRRLPGGVPDGTSSTIFYAERYSGCSSARSDYSGTEARFRPTFADGGPLFGGKNSGDVHPIRLPDGSTGPSRPGVTFQVRPRVPSWDEIIRRPDPGARLPGECDPSYPQTPHPGGLQVGYGDGSVRTVSRGVSPAVFWGQITPDGGEVISE